MILLRKYLYGEAPPEPSAADAQSAYAFCAALTQLANALLAAVEQHVFREPHTAFQVFSLEASRMRERLEGNLALDEIGAITSEAAALLEQFRQVRDQVQRTEADEVQKMVGMLNDTIAVLSSGSERSVARLRQIEHDLKQTSALSDIVALKARLGDCLRYVREQSAKERDEASRNLVRMERDVQRAQEGLAVARAGICSRMEAEETLAKAVQNAEAAMAIFVLDRCSSIKARFSPVVAERFLSLFAQDLAQNLPSPNKLYRWNDYSVLAELADTKVFSARNAELREKMNAIPRERQLDVGQRLAVFSNSHRWTLIRPADSSSHVDAILRLDHFVKT